MAMTLETRTGATRWFESVLRSYAQVFFANSPWIGLLLMSATVVEPSAFGFGALAVVIATLVARLLAVDGELATSGYFGYNALLVGVGIGHFYSGSWLALPVVVLAAAASVVLTCAARAWLTRYLHLPVLSLPFLAVFWLVARAAPDLGLVWEPSDAAWSPSSAWIPALLAGYARSLGSVLFVPSVRAGTLIAVALLIYSRVAALLSFGAFALVFAVNASLPSPLPPPVFAAAAANAMLLSIAVGGVWFVASRWSALWSGVATLLCLLVTVGVARPLADLGFPTLFLPFNLLSVAVLLGARERGADRKPKSVDFAPGSPEENLRYFLNQRVRFPLTYGIRFHLPFHGRWICTQDVDGEYTHQGPWRHAFDFQVVGEDAEVFSGDPGELAHYHCYRLPVLAAAPGVVVRVENDIPDNPVGEMDLVHNWGNFVMLEHAPGLYSLVAHLSQRSVKVREGQRVIQGEVVGLCGNSGRSPTPHVHFHLQKAPFLGAETVAMSFADVVMAAAIGERLEISHVPRKGEVCRNLEPSTELAAHICPRSGDAWQMRLDGRVETIRVDLDLVGQTFLHSSEEARAACTRTGDLHILHEVVGGSGSILSLLRAALPRLPFEENASLVWMDYAPAPSTGRLGPLVGLAALLVPRPGLAMSYTIHREGARLVVEGASFRKDRLGEPLLRTQVALDGGAAPVSIVVRHRGKERRALRVSEVTAFPSSPAAPAPVGDLSRVAGPRVAGETGHDRADRGSQRSTVI
jgi:urea transporter